MNNILIISIDNLVLTIFIPATMMLVCITLEYKIYHKGMLLVALKLLIELCTTHTHATKSRTAHHTCERLGVAKSPLSTARNAFTRAGVVIISCFCMYSTSSSLLVGDFILTQ